MTHPRDPSREGRGRLRLPKESESSSKPAVYWESLSRFVSSLPPYEPLHPTLAAVYRDFGVGLAPASVPKEFYSMRGRIVFPIHNAEGRVVALAGRYTGLPSSRIPKYINSENTELYRKSQTLYALHRAQESIKLAGYVCLVEGYKDCLAMHAGGFTQTVALCGKELTDGQLDLLRPLTNRIIIMLDGDEAGRTGAQKIALRLKASGIPVSIAELPDGEDPDSLFWHLGYDEFIRFINRRIHPAKPEETELLSFIIAHRNDTYEVEGMPYTLPALLDHLQQRDYLPFKDRAYQAILAHLTLGHALTLLPSPLWNEVSEIQARHEEETEEEVSKRFHSLYFEYVEARVFGHLMTLFSALRDIPAGEERERQLRRIIYRKELLGTVTEELHRTATGLCGTVSVFLL